MKNIYHKAPFKKEKEELIALYNRIPKKNTITFFIKDCFYDFTTETYSNLNKKDRKEAFFYNFIGTDEEWQLKEKQYYTEFPKKEAVENSISIDGEIKDRFHDFTDLKITQSSIEILNDVFFEYKITKQINEFKDLFNSFIDEYINSKKHQLFVIKEEIEKKKILLSKLKSTEPNINSINYNKFYDIINVQQKRLDEFLNKKFTFIESNNREIISIYNNSRKLELLNIIDGENSLPLFYKFEEHLIKNNYLDKESLIWIDLGGKSSFMRFYLKCDKHSLIKRGKRFKLIRMLSDIYKIDGVVKHDYGKDRCKKALDAEPTEFDELGVIASQHNLNLKKK